MVSNEKRELSEDDIDFMIDNWENFTKEQFAQRFGVEPETIKKRALQIKKMSKGKACHSKRANIAAILRSVLRRKGLI